MSTALIVGILILLLVVGVPIVQALIRAWQRRRSLSLESVAELRAAGLRREELPRGLSPQGAQAVTSEEIALADENPQATIRQLDDAGRVIGYRESFRDPRSWGEFPDWLLAQTLHRRRAHRRVELELTLYEGPDQAAEVLNGPLQANLMDDGVRVEDAGERSGLLAREWTRTERGDTVQRMLELRWVSGAVIGVLRGDSEPGGHLDDDDVWNLARIVKDRLP